jgi:hypothetical protein
VRPAPFDRAVLGISGLFFAVVAAALLFAPRFFYDVVPGVAESGPANLHLLRDVGLTYAVFALGFAFARNDVTPACVVTAAAALYLTGHAALHATLVLTGGSRAIAWAEAPGVYLPALAALALAARFGAVSRTARFHLKRDPSGDRANGGIANRR